MQSFDIDYDTLITCKHGQESITTTWGKLEEILYYSGGEHLVLGVILELAQRGHAKYKTHTGNLVSMRLQRN